MNNLFVVLLLFMIDVIKYGENENSKFWVWYNIDFFFGLWFNGD